MKLPADATEFIPQKAPFVMVDTLLESDENRTVTGFFIREDNVLVEDNYFRESGMIENMAQSLAAGRGWEGRKNNLPPQIGFIGSVKNLTVHFFPSVNTEIQTEVVTVHKVLNFTSVYGKVFSEGKIAAECELVVAVQNE